MIVSDASALTAVGSPSRVSERVCEAFERLDAYGAYQVRRSSGGTHRLATNRGPCRPGNCARFRMTERGHCKSESRSKSDPSWYSSSGKEMFPWREVRVGPRVGVVVARKARAV
jgi:hypothetical protein